MTPDETRYDLVFFGTDLQGAQRTEAFNKLARVMKVGPDQVEQVLEKSGGLIARALRRDVGDQAQRKLMAIGIRCNLRPCTASGTKLELVPLEKPDTVMTCPACGQIYRLKGDEQAPTVCGACGIVFAKYDKVAAEKEERERIRQALLAKHERMLDQERKDAEQREERERRERLEEEIRKQLGLPRMITSRTGLISSAAGIFLLGLTLGTGGFLAYDLLSQSGPIAQEPSSSAAGALAAGIAASGSLLATIMAAADAGLPLGALDPGMVGQMQIAEQFAASRSTAAVTDPGGTAAVTPTTAPGSSGQPAATAADARGPSAAVPSPPSTAEVIVFLDNKLDDLKVDAEWDLHVLGQIDVLQGRGLTTQAATLVDYLRKPERRFDRGARLAASLWREGNSADAEKLYLHLSNAAEKLPDGPATQVKALCTLAHHIAPAGRQTETETLVRRARTIAESIAGPAEKAEAQGQVAALLTNLGQTKEARALFTTATQELGRINDPAERLSAIALLARGYAKAGYRASALNLLEDANSNIGSIPDAEERGRILAAMAETSGLLGDFQTAKSTAQRISSPAEKDRTLYRLMVTEVASDRLENAINLADALRNPAYQAMAFGLLGLQQRHHPTYDALASQSAERASLAVESILDPAQRAAVVAEIGRLAEREGDAAAANQRFAEAGQLIDTVPSARARDRALAILATNEALALRASEALPKIKKITDLQMSDALARDLSHLEVAGTAVGQALPEP
jgi:hypothetical protein